jgi:hypothetical protein
VWLCYTFGRQFHMILLLYYQKIFSRRPSLFMRLSLSPFLLIFAGNFFLEVLTEEENLIFFTFGILCISGFLALWGVPFAGRITSGIISLFSVFSVVAMLTELSFGGSFFDIFFVILFLSCLALPCLKYTIFGRFTYRRESELECESGETN